MPCHLMTVQMNAKNRLRDFTGMENIRMDFVILISAVMLWVNACSLHFQCQTAALDELFGNPEECFQRYQTAQILLHSLSQQVNHQQDRALLTKCKLCACVLTPACCNDDHLKNFVREQSCNGSLEWTSCQDRDLTMEVCETSCVWYSCMQGKVSEKNLMHVKTDLKIFVRGASRK